MALKTAAKPKYDPNALYEVKRGTISHKGDNTLYSKGDGKTFKMSHRTPSQVEYLVDVAKTIAPVGLK